MCIFYGLVLFCPKPYFIVIKHARWWGDPGYRVSHKTVARKRVTACDEQVGHGANASNSNNTCFRSTDVVSGYTFEACVSERIKFGTR